MAGTVTPGVSVLFNEPKLLKSPARRFAPQIALRCFSALQRAEIAEIVAGTSCCQPFAGFSALQRAEIAEIIKGSVWYEPSFRVSVLFNEPKLLKFQIGAARTLVRSVSVLFNEPKLLKFRAAVPCRWFPHVSVLFNEPKLLKLCGLMLRATYDIGFSALQRAEIAEIEHLQRQTRRMHCFSALQRAEIAEMMRGRLIDRQTTGFQCSSTSRNC